MDDHDIIVRPLLTEKSTLQKENGIYAFRVHPRSNKKMIGSALRKIYGIKVDRVRIITTRGKYITQRNTGGFRPDVKKALVVFKDRQKVTALEDFS